MARKRIASGNRIPAILAAATGIVAVGLLGSPIVSGYEAGVASGYQASGCFMTKSGDRCVDLPDPTEYGCAPGDFKCMFDKKAQQPPPSDG